MSPPAPWGHAPSRLAAAALLGMVLAVCGGVVAGSHMLVAPPAAAPPSPPTAASSVPSGQTATCAAGPAAAAPTPVGSAVLVACPDRFDGRTVRFAGEAVLAVLDRGATAWVQVNDDAYATAGPLSVHGHPLGTNGGMAVRLAAADATAITHVGGPRTTGDVVEVVGRFQAHSPADGGGPAILARSLRVLQRGGPFTPRPATRQRVLALLLIPAAAAAAWWARRSRL